MKLLNLPLNLQCAAVRMKCFDSIAPPQNVLLCLALYIAVPFSHWSSTCQGHSPGSAKFPPTILLAAVSFSWLIWDFFSSSPGLIPQSNSGLYRKEIEIVGTWRWRFKLCSYENSTFKELKNICTLPEIEMKKCWEYRLNLEYSSIQYINWNILTNTA